MKAQKYYNLGFRNFLYCELLAYNTKHFKSSYCCIQENGEVCSNSY